LAGRQSCATVAVFTPCLDQEVFVSDLSSFQEELDMINRELRKSFLKLQSLLEKKQRALKEALILEDKREQEHLETVIHEIEKKIREIKGIGLPPAIERS
jgi:uncharacterized protein (DUF342 family)